MVCDPLSDGIDDHVPSREHGVKGKIFVLDASQPRFQRSEDYVQYGRDLGLDVFMSQIQIQPRYFREGFRPDGGPALRTPEGEKLLEYFGMQLESRIVLGEGEAPGRYQFALLSDDGATMQVLDAAGDAETLISFEGGHAPGLGCAMKAVELDADSGKSVRITYFQGPRYQLALMLLWRRIDSDSGQSLSDPHCGKYENNRFFKVTPSSAPAPRKAYLDLLRRGWKPLRPENFLLPEGRNRCR